MRQTTDCTNERNRKNEQLKNLAANERAASTDQYKEQVQEMWDRIVRRRLVAAPQVLQSTHQTPWRRSTRVRQHCDSSWFGTDGNEINHPASLRQARKWQIDDRHSRNVGKPCYWQWQRNAVERTC